MLNVRICLFFLSVVKSLCLHKVFLQLFATTETAQHLSIYGDIYFMLTGP